MKTITRKNLSLYLFDSEKPLAVTAENIAVGDPVEFIISDCNSNNTVLHENVIAPQDWAGYKYFFDGSTWTVNPDWVSHETITARRAP